MPRPSRPWFRMYVETFSDRKILRLTPTQRWLWVSILGAARESPKPGYLVLTEGVPMTHGELARYADVRPREVAPALETMRSLGMLTVEGDLISVCNWDSRQHESDVSTPRTQAHRERSKEQGKTVPTNRVRNAPETETESEQILSSPLRDDVERLCTLLADKIESNGAKRPTITKAWRDAARLMIDSDDRTEDQITRCINWCQADEFWRTNILSMPKLRDKYDQLRMKAKQASGVGKPKVDALGFVIE